MYEWLHTNASINGVLMLTVAVMCIGVHADLAAVLLGFTAGWIFRTGTVA